jgi:hypothetical protein
MFASLLRRPPVVGVLRARNHHRGAGVDQTQNAKLSDDDISIALPMQRKSKCTAPETVLGCPAAPALTCANVSASGFGRASQSRLFRRRQELHVGRRLVSCKFGIVGRRSG